MRTPSVTNVLLNSQFIAPQPSSAIDNQLDITLDSAEGLFHPLLKALSTEPTRHHLIEDTLSETAHAINLIKHDTSEQRKLLDLLEESTPGYFSACQPTHEDWEDAIKSVTPNNNENDMVDIISLLIELMSKVGKSMRERGEQILPILCAVYMVNYSLGKTSAELINESTLNSSKDKFIDAMNQFGTIGINYPSGPLKNHTIPIDGSELNRITPCTNTLLNDWQSLTKELSSHQLDNCAQLGEQLHDTSESMLNSLGSIDVNIMKSLINDASGFINIEADMLASSISNNDSIYLNSSRR